MHPEIHLTQTQSRSHLVVERLLMHLLATINWPLQCGYHVSQQYCLSTFQSLVIRIWHHLCGNNVANWIRAKRSQELKDICTKSFVTSVASSAGAKEMLRVSHLLGQRCCHFSVTFLFSVRVPFLACLPHAEWQVVVIWWAYHRKTTALPIFVHPSSAWIITSDMKCSGHQLPISHSPFASFS